MLPPQSPRCRRPSARPESRKLLFSEGRRQELGHRPRDRSGWADGVDPKSRTELGQDLAAGSAGCSGGIDVGDDDGAAESVDARAHGGTDRGPLGADRETIGSVLDVAADEHRSVFRFERTPDVELRVGSVGAEPARLAPPRRVDQSLQTSERNEVPASSAGTPRNSATV